MGTLYDLLKGTNIPGAGNRFWNWASKVSLAVDEGGGAVCGIQIPADGEISGTYDCDVLCLGNVTATGDVTVRGSLKVLGDFTNSGRHALTVSGDLYANYMNFYSDDDALPQSNISIGGDFLLVALDFYQTGGQAATLTVGGDVVARSNPNYDPPFTNYGAYLDGTGVSGNPGLSILVSGNLVANYVAVSGGLGTATVGGGAGGVIRVHGSVVIYSDSIKPHYNNLLANGGDSNDTSASLDGGLGGHISIGGDFLGFAPAVISGGISRKGNGAKGGTFACYGSVAAAGISANGGDCFSNTPTDSAGAGGSIYIRGDVSADSLMAKGGIRQSSDTITDVGYPNTTGDGGSVQVSGNVTAGYISVTGGRSDADFLASGTPGAAGGKGGTFEVGGSTYILYELNSFGGEAAYGNGGNGGFVFLQGDVYINKLAGQAGNAINNGSGGGFTLTPLGYANVRILGNAVIGAAILKGGDGKEGSGGNGGSLDVYGTLHIRGVVDPPIPPTPTDTTCVGGACNSTIPANYAGVGGKIICRGLTVDSGKILLDGGLRNGNTTGAASNTPPNAGQLQVYGDAVLSGNAVVYANGGDISTPLYANSSVGAYGGTFIVTGTLSAAMNYGTESFIAQGGNVTVSATAGAGGSLECGGFAALKKVDLRGGSASFGSTRGRGGSATFWSGVSCTTIDQRDGTGGNTASGPVALVLGGPCSFGTIDMTSRTTSTTISAWGGGCPAPTLKVLAMPTKNTLNRANGTELSSSVTGYLQNSIFVSGDDGGILGWYVATGLVLT